MTARELKKKYLDFFVGKGHEILPNVSLIPENDPTALFISAGMHPLVPYLLGEPHPQGQRLVSVQRCLRTDDIDEVGDAVHHTFFEMLGNWSLGDYWKKETIEWSYEFLTSELKLDPKRLYISCFGGDQDAPRDEESAKIWQKVGIPKEKIYFYGKAENWWGPAGKTGPCGPDTEMFYDVTGKPCDSSCHPNDNCGRFFEIWNDVFMEHNKTKEGEYEPLKQKNVDTGMGVERMLAVMNGLPDDYRTDLFWPIIEEIERLCGRKYEENLRGFRIVADHLRAAVFILAEGLEPSNVDRGYVLRRLIRRAIRYGKRIGAPNKFNTSIAQVIINQMEIYYPELRKKENYIQEQLILEEKKFQETLAEGLKKAKMIFEKKIPIDEKRYSRIMQTEDKKEILTEIYKVDSNKDKAEAVLKFRIPITLAEIQQATISGKEAFDLYQTFGFPMEMTLDLVQEKNLFVDGESFQKELERHRELSRTASAGMFKGGLADHSEEVTRLHTATHLLHQALRQVLGEHVRQSGSNITAERLRFDFSHPQKLTDEEIEEVEELVNQKIRENLPVEMEMMSLEEAKEKGAMAFFAGKYGEKVKVYTIGGFSREVCGGPHVDFTGKLGKFKIIKEEAAGAGIRRIYATLGHSA